MILSVQQRDLFVELGVHITLGTTKANGFPNATGKFVNAFYHSSISTWEDSFGFLEKIGIFKIDEHGLDRLCVGEDNLRAHLENYSQQMSDNSLLEESLELFVDIFVGALGLLPTTRHIHQLPEEYSDVFTALSNLDYVRQVAKGWEWTHSIEPVMKSVFIELDDFDEI